MWTSTPAPLVLTSKGLCYGIFYDNKLPFLDPSVLARPGDLTPDDVADMHRVDGVIDSDDVFDIPAAADGAASDEGARDTHACASAPDDGCCPRVTELS